MLTEEADLVTEMKQMKHPFRKGIKAQPGVEILRGPVKRPARTAGKCFECGGYQCWCGKMVITQQQMDWIEKSFHDCLCPLCLQQVVEGRLGPASVTKPQ